MTALTEKRSLIHTALGISLCTLAVTVAWTAFASRSVVLASLAIGISSAFFPRATVLLLLFSLPLFGNKPGTMQAQALTVFGLSIEAGLLLRRTPKWLPAPTPFWFYAWVSAISLVPFSIFDAWGLARASIGSASQLEHVFHFLSGVLLSREDEYGYSVLSVLWTLLAISVGSFIARDAQSSSVRIQYGAALAAGLVASLAVGLADYYSLIDLRFVRPLDPVVNPQDTQFRLQSWFGHSGWFAEYVTLLAPSLMLILLLPLRFASRVVLLLLTLLVGEFVLILTFQRGGWLSYPLTLLAVWAAVYVLRQLERGRTGVLQALKQSAAKIIVSIPITIAVSLITLKIFGSQFGLEQYANRFADISKASDRSAFAVAGLKLGNLSPIYGLGSESFALRYEREFEATDGNYRGQIILPLHGSAHNLYAQTYSGKGLLGLLGLLGIMFIAARRALVSAISRGSQFSPADRVVALSATCSICAVCIYGFVQEVFYVQSLQYAFFATCGICFSFTNFGRDYTSRKVLGFVLGLSIVLHLLWLTYVYPPRSLHAVDGFEGCYDLELNEAGRAWRWCGMRSSLELKTKEIANFRLQLAPSDKRIGTQTIDVSTCGQMSTITLKQGEEKELPPPACDSGDKTRYDFTSGNYFVPSTRAGDVDRRVLSFKVSASHASW